MSRKIRIETDQRTVVSLELEGEYEMRNEPCQIRRASRTTKLRPAAAKAKRRRTTLSWYRRVQSRAAFAAGFLGLNGKGDAA